MTKPTNTDLEAIAHLVLDRETSMLCRKETTTMTEPIDLLAVLKASVLAAKARREQRARDNEPCPTCGGDRLRTDFTNPDRCHVSRKDQPND